MKAASFLLSLSLLIPQSLLGAESKLFILEKTFNSQNILVVHAVTNNECKFVPTKNGYVDYYWIMDRGPKEWRKEVDGLIRSNVEKRVKFLDINSTRDVYRLHLAELSEVRHDLQDTVVEVTASIQGGLCVTKPVLKMGPSLKYRKLSLSKVFCETATSFGIPTGCKKIVLSGSDADTNEKLRDVTYYAK